MTEDEKRMTFNELREILYKKERTPEEIERVLSDVRKLKEAYDKAYDAFNNCDCWPPYQEDFFEE